MTHDILTDLIHHCAVWAWVEAHAETGQWPPDSELTRRRAYQLCKTETRQEEDYRAKHLPAGA